MALPREIGRSMRFSSGTLFGLRGTRTANNELFEVKVAQTFSAWALCFVAAPPWGVKPKFFLC